MQLYFGIVDKSLGVGLELYRLNSIYLQNKNEDI